jgi:hypothetical protein
MLCPKCNRQASESQTFCVFCGANLASSTAAPQAQPQTPRKYPAWFWWSLAGIVGVTILAAIPGLVDTSQQPAVAQPETAETSASTGQSQPVTSHQQRLTDLQKKRDAIELAIAIERDTIAKVLREEGPQGVPEDEDDRVQRLIQEKQAIDAAIKEEEHEGGSEPEPSPPTVLQTLPQSGGVPDQAPITSAQPDSHANEQSTKGNYDFGPRIWRTFARNPTSPDDFYEFDSNPKNILQGATGNYREHTVMVWTRHHKGGEVADQTDIGINCTKKEFEAIDVQDGSRTEMQPINNQTSPIYLLYEQVCEPSALP